jgi:hypothetical protein
MTNPALASFLIASGPSLRRNRLEVEEDIALVSLLLSISRPHYILNSGCSNTGPRAHPLFVPH